MPQDTTDSHRDPQRHATDSSEPADSSEVSDTTARIRIFDEDYKEVGELLNEAQPMFRTLTIQDIIREAIRVGLPTVARKYRAAIKAAANESKKQG